MPTWNADQYMKFADERTQPCRDLVSRIAVRDARTIIDLGCGPGNSTGVLAARWPDATITGLDNSSPMIETARREQPQHRWIVSDITGWASEEGPQFDVVFSNAALQWVPDHAALYPKILARVARGGAFAAQMPADINAPPHRLMREIMPAAGMHVREWHAHPPSFYYDLLAPLAARVDIWEIEYQHVLPNAGAIVEWYKGTGLRPFLEALASDADRAHFLAEYLKNIQAAYPTRPDGRVLFPFQRLFVVAYATL